MNGSFTESVKVAKKFTNPNVLNNAKRKLKQVTHPHGQSFDAVRQLKESHDHEDPFLIYDLDNGLESGPPYVGKSSRRKVLPLPFYHCYHYYDYHYHHHIFAIVIAIVVMVFVTVVVVVVFVVVALILVAVLPLPLSFRF